MRIIKLFEDAWDASSVYDSAREQSLDATIAELSGDAQAAGEKADSALQEMHDSYRTAAAQDEIDEAQDAQIAGVKSAVFDWYPVNLKITFAQGGIDSSGQAANSPNFARSGWFDALTASYKIAPKNGCKLWAFYYTEPDKYHYANIVDAITDAAMLKKGYYVRLVAGNMEGTAFTAVEGMRSFIAYEYGQKEQVEDEIDAICSNEAETLKYAIDSNSAVILATDGSASTVNDYSRTDFVDVSNFDYVVFSNVQYDASTTQFGAAFYSDAAVNTFISGVCADILADVVSYKTKVVKVPDGAKYVRFTLMQALDGFFAKGIRKKPLSGLYLSLLGDSMSAGDSNSPGGKMKASAGGLYTPAGNDMYYNGSRGGVTNISEMWWKRLCDATGMIPLVIDAWSGTSICYNYAQNDSSHLDTQKIPMCSAARTGRLSKDGHAPDIIIIAGGGNDWSYAAAATGSYRATTPIGNWDGHAPVNPTAIDSGDSTFMESYAYMIKRLRENYPNAIIVASTVWRSVGRGSFDPATPTATSEGLVLLNAVGNSTQDYSKAIEQVCKIMDVPLVNVADIGITYENAYPTYVQDNATMPTHTNPTGQAIIAKRYIEELPRLVKQFK